MDAKEITVDTLTSALAKATLKQLEILQYKENADPCTLDALQNVVDWFVQRYSNAVKF